MRSRYTAYNQWTLFEQFPQFMEGVAEVTRTDDRHNHWRTKVGGATRKFEKTADLMGLVDRRVKGDLLRFKQCIEGRGFGAGASPPCDHPPHGLRSEAYQSGPLTSAAKTATREGVPW